MTEWQLTETYKLTHNPFYILNWIYFKELSEGTVAGKASGLRAAYSTKGDAAEFISKYQSFVPFPNIYTWGNTYCCLIYLAYKFSDVKICARRDPIFWVNRIQYSVCANTTTALTLSIFLYLHATTHKYNRYGTVNLKGKLMIHFSLCQIYGRPGQRSRYSDSLRDGRSGDRNPVRGEIFRTRPDLPWDPPILPYNEYRVFPVEKRPGLGVNHTPHLRPRLKEE